MLSLPGPPQEPWGSGALGSAQPVPLGARCEKVSVLGGAVGTRAMPEPVRTFLWEVQRVWCACRPRVGALAQRMDGQRAQGLWSAVSSWLVRATPAFSPQVPADPHCPLHPISQPSSLCSKYSAPSYLTFYSPAHPAGSFT